VCFYRHLENGLLGKHPIDLDANVIWEFSLCLFGDNAYINTLYMETPYPRSRLSAGKDSYNFYQLQLQIQIDCAFGKFTQH
jgi:hypothetical protein